MKVLIPIAEQHYRSFVTVVDMMNRGFPDEQIFAEMKARRGDLASLGGAMVQAVEAMGGFPGSPPEPPPSGWNPPTEQHDSKWQGARSWGDRTPIKTVPDGIPFASDTWLCWAIAIPASDPLVMSVHIAEFQGPEDIRQINISRYPFDYRERDPNGVNGPIHKGEGKSAYTFASIGNGPGQMRGGQTYYVNARNFSTELGPSPPGQPAGAIIQFKWDPP